MKRNEIKIYGIADNVLYTRDDENNDVVKTILEYYNTSNKPKLGGCRIDSVVIEDCTFNDKKLGTLLFDKHTDSDKFGDRLSFFDCTFVKTVFKGIDFNKTKLSFNDSSFIQCNFIDCVFCEDVFKNSMLNKTDFINLKDYKGHGGSIFFRNCVLSGVEFYEQNLDKLVFSKTVLKQVNYNNCNIKHIETPHIINSNYIVTCIDGISLRIGEYTHGFDEWDNYFSEALNDDCHDIPYLPQNQKILNNLYAQYLVFKNKKK